jgi:hypothetical protein
MYLELTNLDLGGPMGYPTDPRGQQWRAQNGPPNGPYRPDPYGEAPTGDPTHRLRAPAPPPNQYGQPYAAGNYYSDIDARYPASAPNPASSTNSTAIAALVFAILFAPVGIVLGYIARRQISRTGEGGRGLATAALIIGYVFIAIPIIIYIVAVLVVTVSRTTDINDRRNTPTITITNTP